MTKEEFEKNLKERLKNAINDYKKEFKEIDKIEVLDAVDFFLRDEKLKALELRLKNRIISENHATITFFNLTGKKSPTSIGGAMNCPIVF